ncbi:MAG TPA: DUF503 domain-containing protein [Desulfobacteraceae bacterium]|nr:DUF503 domain-containing protein [Desulfobacteraceae bacterium]
MIVGIIRLELLIPENCSLKGKRKIVKSIIDRVKNRFNASVAEIGSNDKWQKIEIGISTVGNEGAYVDTSLQSILKFIEGLYVADIINIKTEIIHF